MLILPAIDVRGGRVVRLVQGDFARETAFGDDPVRQARAFAASGATWVHVVDLDGAKAGAMAQAPMLGAMAVSVAEAGTRVQAGGGVRTRADVAALLTAGVARVVVGSVAVAEPARVREWADEFGGERLAVALDVALGDEPDPVVMVRGWQESGGVSLWAALAGLMGSVRHVLVTDVSRDGAMGGPNLALIAGITRRWPGVALQASGGVATLDDLVALRGTGADAAIVGRALYEGAFTLEEALAC